MKLLVTPTAPDPPFTDRPKPGPAQQFDANQIQALIQGYPAGATTHELSDLLGIDRRTVNAILHRQDEHQNLAPTLLRGVVVGGLRCLPPGEQVKSQRDLSRTLELAASVLGDGDEPLLRFSSGEDTVPSRQRLAAVAVLADREAGKQTKQTEHHTLTATKHMTRRDVRAHHSTQIV